MPTVGARHAVCASPHNRPVPFPPVPASSAMVGTVVQLVHDGEATGPLRSCWTCLAASLAGEHDAPVPTCCAD